MFAVFGVIYAYIPVEATKTRRYQDHSSCLSFSSIWQFEKLADGRNYGFSVGDASASKILPITM
jgi:hypothetical protein